MVAKNSTQAAAAPRSQTKTARNRRNRLSDQIAEKIKDKLIADGLQPGDKLPTEPELADLYDVSRSVVREAGRILDERGLVDIRPGRGMIVAEFDGTSISRQFELMLELKHGAFPDLMEMRLVLEVGMTELAAQRRTPADEARIRTALKEFSAAGDDHVSALAWDLEFHEAIAAASGNQFFVHIVNPINEYLHRVYETSLGYEAAQNQTMMEHTEIAEAIFAGDAAAAKEASLRHLTRIYDSAEQLLDPLKDA